MIHNSLLKWLTSARRTRRVAKKTHVVLALMQDAQQVRKSGISTISYPIPAMFQHHSPMISKVSLRRMPC